MKFVMKYGMAALLWSALTWLPPTVWALQAVSGHDQTVVKISNRDLNRIVLPHGILKVYTSKGIDVKVEGRQAYVKVPETITGPVELYLLTAEETYTLMLVPAPIPAETVVIKGGQTLRAPLEAQAYVGRIKDLLREIGGGSVPAGYDSVLLADEGEHCLVKECSLVAVRRYTGPKLSVIEYRLANPTKDNRTYKEQLFVRTGTRAVAIERHRLKPGEATRLFLVEEVIP